MSNIICIICVEDLTNGSSLVARCGHMFHDKCLKSWMKKKPECPECSGDLENLIKIYPKNDGTMIEELEITIKDLLAAQNKWRETSQNEIAQLKKTIQSLLAAQYDEQKKWRKEFGKMHRALIISKKMSYKRMQIIRRQRNRIKKAKAALTN